MTTYLQRNQPPGVPPLELTGERTLPDVPEENYWYRRHLAVYRWIAARCDGLRVVDMACGEGYGSAVLAEHAADVTGVDANPEAHEHARLRYGRPGLRFERGLVEEWDDGAPWDAIVFLQTIEHVPDPAAMLSRFRRLLAPGGVAYVSTPNRLTLAPAGAERSDNPWHVREYTPAGIPRPGRPGVRQRRPSGPVSCTQAARPRAGAAAWLGPRARGAAASRGPSTTASCRRSASATSQLRRGSLERSLDLLAVCRP